VSIVVRKGAAPNPPRRGRRRKYPLDTMSVGEFFDTEASYQAIWSSIRYFRTKCKKRSGCPEFQLNSDQQPGLIRVTRIS